MDAATLRNDHEGSRGLAWREGGATRRAPLLRSALALVEDVATRGTTRSESSGFSPDFQVCFPYRGLFVYHVGADDVVSDANQVVFVSSGEPYRLTEPIAGGYGEVIVTLSPELLAELVGTSVGGLRFHPLFRRRRRRADERVQLLRARLLYASENRREPLASDELLLELLRCALVADAPAHRPSPATRRLIARAKEFVEAHAADTLRLDDVARAVGASPAYLTDVFRRHEGLPLHRYAVQLRLARALVELPHAADLTALALDLGFSSHSHFTAAFRRAFGCTPSEFRESTRCDVRPRRTAAGWHTARAWAS
jgi:AraC family transcriptional regulator